MKKSYVLFTLVAVALAGCARKADQSSAPVTPVNSTQDFGLGSLVGLYETVEIEDRQLMATLTTSSGAVLNCNSSRIGEPDLTIGVRRYFDDETATEIPSVQVNIDAGFSKGVCFKDGLVLFRDRGEWTEKNGASIYIFSGHVKKTDSVSDPLVSTALKIDATFTPITRDIVRVIAHESHDDVERTISFLLRRK